MATGFDTGKSFDNTATESQIEYERSVVMSQQVTNKTRLNKDMK